MTKEKLSQLKESLELKLKYWQKVLRLQDWKFEIKLLPRGGNNEVGHIAFNLNARYATITLAQDSLTSEALDTHYSIEENMLHEMIHVLITPLGDHPKTLEEQAIESFTEALMRLRYDNSPDQPIGLANEV